MHLKDSTLLRDSCYIGGKWTRSDNGQEFDVTDPANGEVITQVPDCGSAETRRAIDAANAAREGWQAHTAKERAGILKRWFDLMMENQEDLARIMTAEQGKPLAESRGEIAFAASFVEWFAEESKRVYGDTVQHPLPGKRIVVLKQPVGVTAAITPWNFPAAMITRKCAPALAVGCTTIIKPAEQTPLTALALAELAERAGLPGGVLNMVTGNPKDIGREMTSNPIVRKISFTGSTEVGKLLIEQSASTVKKVSMELGGNSPFIVFNDADLDAALEGAMASKFRNTGQTCVCANRILVQEGIYDAFAERMAEAVGRLKVGAGTEEGVQQGPLIDEAALSKVETHVRDAKEKGASVMIGGSRHELGGTFYQPTVLRDVNREMVLNGEETFGPVAPLLPFRDEDEAIGMANDTQYGLASYFYSRDIGRVWRVAEAMEYGIVAINEGIFSTEVAPFGGVKESGIGREGSKYGIDEYLEIKYLCMGGIA
ncbi:MAG: Glutarate-semialdehyde dehydrogenase DavD [Gammaproteobacteria bacterium]|nr:Glutarate-semialdehyde dehydrogenase DavD [Gammaproteobacteria bacterium]